jgi:5-methyltetrahydrofolate--homocysteine methyltransferase
MPTNLPCHESDTALRELFARRIALLDGAMGTMIQRHPLTEEDFRGDRFKDHGHDLKGNNDLLSITRPNIIKGIHRAYFDAGSDIVETNTFSTTTVSQADYALEGAVREINLAGAKVAREAAEEFMAANPGRRVFVAGSVGPTNRTASMSPDVNNPGYRAVNFDGLVVSYSEQIEALLDGGVDLLLLETVFDTLNLKAAIFACEEVFEKRGMRWPIILSVTITDASGRTLSGQTVEAFWNSVRHSKPLAVGINCALGAAEALSARPELLIADEPTTALDVTIQKQILDKLRDLQKDLGMAVLLITHNFAIIGGLARHVAVMYRGEVVEFGETDQVLRNPKHPYTQALIACIPRLGDRRRRLPTIRENDPSRKV